MGTDETIKATINAVCAARGMSLADLGDAVGIPKASMYYKMNHGFYAREAARIADYLGLDVADLHAGRIDVTALTDHSAPRKSGGRRRIPNFS